jgi:bifunctional non-homologous end joining protein LigD
VSRVPRKLSEYLAKRDFAKTAEPAGKSQIRPSGKSRFVIQKHDATRLHYDLRLELDGVFKSWAVTKGPSLNPADKRLAVEVEDHPLDYGDFEGTIPKGQYGGGTVQLWDRGYWQPEGRLTPEQALAKGDLKFTLDGDRLLGCWVLVRIKNDRMRGKRTNWLLIKHRDDHALDSEGAAILANDRSVASSRTMAAIAAGTGRAPKPFMLAGKSAAADAVWDSRHGLAAKIRDAAEIRGDGVTRRSSKPHAAKIKSTPGLPEFIAPQLCGKRRKACPGGGMGARNQVRRLPHSNARARWGRDAENAQGPRLDGKIRRTCARRGPIAERPD